MSEPGDMSERGNLGHSQPPGEGSIVAGKYRLVGLLGRGGMGSVWEGVHTSLDTRVAVKFIETEFANQAEVRDRFFNEAFAAARLKSKHIVQVYDHGVDEAGRPYIVMEFLSGEALDQRLVREGTLTLADAATLLLQVGRAVRKAHEAGIIHRDLKPENVFLVWDEEDSTDLVKVVDFGIAKFTDRSGISSATRTGAVIGTPHFMSPEQARGLKAVDERADVWSIGVIAYRAVTGVLPFDGEAVGDLLVKICTAEHVPPSKHVPVPAAFDEWMRRSLAKEPGDRFSNAQQQSQALASAAGLSAPLSPRSIGQAGKRLVPSAVSADTSSPVAASAGATTRPLVRWRLGLALFVGLCGAAVAFVWQRSVEPTGSAAEATSEPAGSAAGQGVSTLSGALDVNLKPSTEPATARVEPQPTATASSSAQQRQASGSGGNAAASPTGTLSTPIESGRPPSEARDRPPARLGGRPRAQPIRPAPDGDELGY